MEFQQHPLIQAAAEGDLDRVVELIDNANSVDSLNPVQYTPLMAAACSLRLTVVEELLAQSNAMEWWDTIVKAVPGNQS